MSSALSKDADGFAATIAMGGSIRLTKGAGQTIFRTQGGGVLTAGLNRKGQLGRQTEGLDYGGVSPRSPKSTQAAPPSEALRVFDQQAEPFQLWPVPHEGQIS